MMMNPGARRDLGEEHQQRSDLFADVAEVEVLLKLLDQQDPDRHPPARVTRDLAGQLALRADIGRHVAEPVVSVLCVGLDVVEGGEQDLGAWLAAWWCSRTTPVTADGMVGSGLLATT